MTSTPTPESRKDIEAEMPWADRELPATVYDMLCRTAEMCPDRAAITFQLLSDPGSKAVTVPWQELRRKVTQTANLFRDLGIREGDVIAYLLPNANETVYAMLGGMTAGIVCPINPLLETEQIAAILNDTGARVLVTLKPFPKSDVAQKAAEAVAAAPGIETLIEVDLLSYLAPPKSWLVPLVRPRVARRHRARVLNFTDEIRKRPQDALSFEQNTVDRVAAYFHTGGTTGSPKVAQHKFSGMIYNGWLGHRLIFRQDDVLICPLPLFHVFASYPVLMSALQSGAHVVFPTPAGYRGDGVFDNFWKLIERWQVTFLITVPTALSILMQRKVDADVSSLKVAISGSAPLAVELYNRFEIATGVKISEGYGLTEATCLVSCNPIYGKKKIGSVGPPMPYTDVRILHCDEDGTVRNECATDEIGEICVANPGVFEGSTYTESGKNLGLYADRIYLRTGDLGRLDADGYLWITGRQKDLIIRGGHNIDPAEIESTLSGHEAVAMVGAIGQPDAHSGELPCAYVELVSGASVTEADLIAYCAKHIHERAAVPKYLEIMDELPKTAVGKVFKPDLRRRAITRVYDAALAEAGLAVTVAAVVEDKKLGLVAELRSDPAIADDRVENALGDFVRPWRWA